MSVEARHAYAAGLFDGEGCVVVTQRKLTGQWQFQLQLSNCDVRALDFMKSMYGGHVRIAEKVRDGCRYPIGMWGISGWDSEYAARKMLRYSILKKEQLRLFLKMRETVVERGQWIAPEVHDYRAELARQITSLKRPQMKVKL